MVCVGIDVAKDKHDCFILSSEGEVLADVFTITNNREGFKTLLQRIQSCTRPSDKIKVGLEAAMIKAKQTGNPSEVIAYADKANERLQRKFYKIAFRSKHNIAKTAVARELACFVWGMMTGNISNAA